MNDTIKQTGNDFVVVKKEESYLIVVKQKQPLPGTIEEAIEDNHDDVDEILKSDLFKQAAGKTKYFTPFKTKLVC